MPMSEYQIKAALDLIEAQSIGRPASIKELSEVMYKLIRFRGSHLHSAIKLVELNRRYGSAAAKLGGSSREAIRLLVQAGLVDAVQIHGNTVVFDFESLQDALAPVKDAEAAGFLSANDALVKLAEVRKSFLDRAFIKSAKDVDID